MTMSITGWGDFAGGDTCVQRQLEMSLQALSRLAPDCATKEFADAILNGALDPREAVSTVAFDALVETSKQTGIDLLNETSPEEFARLAASADALLDEYVRTLSVDGSEVDADSGDDDDDDEYFGSRGSILA
ncbi:hypothetical protein [Antrihabitans sp. YC2-6]|uniref:hypothetical protein n=1 Tax=Antrihabitans sp. YC2-6 TaxID=2799498 RepID=UPI0018F5D2CB|nr:hypothetical protein [Antrihabitans sp. YC2-6]MBJ8347454.1 hypothetical protein [Antrihabitans sp. YC2-6]